MRCGRGDAWPLKRNAGDSETVEQGPETASNRSTADPVGRAGRPRGLNDLIVTCQECQTQFQLDDAKVPATGIRVRCSRCKCAFFVESPHRPDPDHASQLARETLAGAQAPGGEASSVSDEESDWQFNEDVDGGAGKDSGDDLVAARSAVDALLGGVSAPSVDPSAREPDASESPFDQLADDDDLSIPDTDFSAGPEPEEDPNAITLDRATWNGPVEDASPDSGLDLDGPFAAGDAGASPERPQPSVPESAADVAEPFGEESEDLGSPAGWDFFEDNDAPPSSAAFSAAAKEPSAAESEAAFGSGDSRAFASSDYASDSELEASRGDAWFARLRGALGWALVTALSAYTGTVMLFPELLASAPDPTAMRVAGFEVVHVEGHWIENAAAGPIYVVSGALHNAGGTRAAPGSVLQVRLIDAHGAEVVAESAAVGPPIPTVRLRESNPRDLRSAQERAAGAMLHDPLERRKRRPFMAVLEDVPAEAVAFDLAVATATAAAPEPTDAIDAALERDARAVSALAAEGVPAEVPAARAAAPAETR